MNLQEILSKADELKPNQYSTDIKVGWITRLDKIILSEVISGREGEEEYSGLRDYSPVELFAVPIAPAPYDEIYVSYLLAQIDYYNNEMNKYNNSLSRFNSEFSAFSGYWSSNHRQKASHPFKY